MKIITDLRNGRKHLTLETIVLSIASKGARAMKVTTTFSRLSPDTIQGEKVAILTVYSSMNKQEIDELEQSLYQTIGTAVVSEVKEQEHE